MGIRYRKFTPQSTLPGDVSLTLNMTVNNHVTSLRVKRSNPEDWSTGDYTAAPTSIAG